MIPLDLINWDRWREVYPSMTFDEHQAIYDAIAFLYPVQQHFSASVVRECLTAAFKQLGRPAVVVEMGGWDGKLADLELQHDWREQLISDWFNWELSREAANAGPEHHRYRTRSFDWLWDQWPPIGDGKPDVFVSTHCIEHLSWKDLRKLISCWLNARSPLHVILEAPIPEKGPVDWTGYCGTHILEVGWTEIAAAMAPAFDLVRAEGFVRHFVRRA